jgi:antitoxin VapB
MALSIKNMEVEQLARELARRRRVSVTEAIRQSLEREVARERLVPRPKESDLLTKLREISDQAGRIPRISDMTDDEILGYDERGIPTR